MIMENIIESETEAQEMMTDITMVRGRLLEGKNTFREAIIY